jgi:hypothetical protein
MPSKKPIWERKNPKAEQGKSKKLTAAQKMRAKKRAKAAGRPYPNMVDNAAVARTSKG